MDYTHEERNEKERQEHDKRIYAFRKLLMTPEWEVLRAFVLSRMLSHQSGKNKPLKTEDLAQYNVSYGREIECRDLIHTIETLSKEKTSIEVRKE